MKPAPKPKPKRIRAVIIYAVPASEYKGLVNEDRVLNIALLNEARFVKSAKFELAAWGSFKRVNSANIVSNKLTSKSKADIAYTKAKRHIDFSTVNPKNRNKRKPH